MKALSFIATLTLHFLSVWMFQYDINSIFAVAILALIAGVVIGNLGKNPGKTIKDIGWGLTYVSLTFIVLLMVIFVIIR